MIKVFFIRHAKAGDRDRWTEPDDVRPLTKDGWRQAEGLVELLKDEAVDRIFSSHYLRCVQTVEPLAQARQLRVEPHEALVEGAGAGAALDVIQTATQPVALCTHGDVLELVIGRLLDAGVDGADPRLGKKGCTWVLSVESRRVVRAVYLEPPA